MVTQRRLAKKKKIWVPVYGSHNYENVFLGESLGEKTGDAMNRVIGANLGDITSDYKRQNIKLKFKVNNIKDNRAIADVIGYKVVGSFLRRSIRKMKNKMDDSFECKTKDGVEVQIKPVMMTRGNAQKSLLSDIRRKARSLITAEVERMSYNETLDAIVSRQLQKFLKDRIKKITPLSVCEIRMMERLS